MNYEQKYIKYKQKYIELKLKQKGGDNLDLISQNVITNLKPELDLKQSITTYTPNTPNIPNTKNKLYKFDTTNSIMSDKQKSPINVLIVTHNARMRCFLDSLQQIFDVNTENTVTNIMKYKLANSKVAVKEIRFMNGSILKVTLYKGSLKGIISLFYNGDVNNRKDGLYFVNAPTTNPTDTVFGVYEFDYTKSFNIGPVETEINFYIVRHGEGTHNLKDNPKYYNFITRSGTDPNLTFDGEMQAKKAGNFIRDTQPPIKFDVVFVSRLNRTRQTAYLILKNSNNIGTNTKFIVLPCSHELQYYENSSNKTNCDSKNYLIPVAPENVGNCQSEKKTLDTCTTECCVFTMTYFDKDNYRQQILDSKKIPQENKKIITDEIETQKSFDSPNTDTNIMVDWNFYNQFYYVNKNHCSYTNMIREAINILQI